MKIRDVEKIDAASITNIYNHYIANTVATFEEEAVSSGEIIRRIEKVQIAEYPWLIIEDGCELVGYAYASRWNERSAYRHTVEISVYLAHVSTGRGYGRRLYEELFERLATTSVHAVIGGIALPNAASVALHEKFGMKKVAHFDAVGYKFNQWIDVGYWQLNFD